MAIFKADFVIFCMNAVIKQVFSPMLKFKKIGCTGVLLLFSLGIAAQNNKAVKLHDVFLSYIQDRLALNKPEKEQLQPLVAQYFADLRQVQQYNSDPLLREQKKIEIKIAYREKFIPVLGQERANRFFVEEQTFRKKIKEELKKRREA